MDLSKTLAPKPLCLSPKGPSVRRDPSQSVLHRVFKSELETFLANFNDHHAGTPLPSYVQRELRAFLSCGDLAQGFARIRCPTCMADLFVAFS